MYPLTTEHPIPGRDATEKNVPEPRYPFHRMKRGESFDVPIDPAKKKGSDASVVNTAARRWREKNAPKQEHTARAVGGVVRVWRVK